MKYTSILLQGNILSGELIGRLAVDWKEEKYQQAGDFGFKKDTDFRAYLGSTWTDTKALWNSYKNRIEKLDEHDPGTTLTRKFWMDQFLFLLNYNLETTGPREINGKTYAISHQAQNLDGFPVLIVGYHDDLDKKPEQRRLRMSPHGLMQEYLNYSDEHLYGLITNGRQLRLLRDTNRLVRLSYVEFDLERMMEEDLFNEFAIMIRLIHSTRMPQKKSEAESSIIEYYHQHSLDSGARIRDKLRDALKCSMQLLAKGMLENPANENLVAKVRDGVVRPELMYKLLLRTMYRIIFLATIEERNLVFEKPDNTKTSLENLHNKRRIYNEYYSIERLRNLAAAPVYINPRKPDLWKSLLSAFRLFEPYSGGEAMGIRPLGGDIFGGFSLKEGALDFYSLDVTNACFIEIIKNLTLLKDERQTTVRVNYRDLDVEELGSVYEALLELHPYFNKEGPKVLFGFSEGSERKTTGSYYTRHDLVAQLIKSALIPVAEERLKNAGWNLSTLQGDKQKAEDAILNIKVCDPAAGSGHFLLATARYLGFELAKIRSGEENPGNEWVMGGVRDVIRHCIYGVDKNPAAVELCKLSLWLVGHNSGKPLTFLDHKIKCGDSLVGVDKLERLQGGIPDGAFRPSTGDHSETAAYFKKANKNFLKTGQFGIFSREEKFKDHQQSFALQYEALAAEPEDSISDYARKDKQYKSVIADPLHHKDTIACDLYAWAFFQPYPEGQKENETVTSELLLQYLKSSGSANAKLEGLANARGREYRFLHWPLEFPDVFEKGGFDIVLGNPPWEIIELKEKEFFETRNKEIAEAENKSEREKLINKLSGTYPDLYKSYSKELNYINAVRKFIQESDLLKYTISGRINTYSVFSELASKLINLSGRVGILVPTGIATDDTNKNFFSSLVEKNRLVSLFDFENRKALFPGVHRSYKFCLLSISGSELPKNHTAKFGFFLQDVLDLQDDMRIFTLTKDDFLKINPNTKTCPVFRTRIDADLTRKIYNRVPVLINERKGWNPWGVTFKQGLFNMSTDSHLFKTAPELEKMGFKLMGNRFVKEEEGLIGKITEVWLPLYEAKMIWHYDHRFGTYKGVEDRSSTHTPTPELKEYQDPNYLIIPWYWINKEKVIEELTVIDSDKNINWIWKYKWFLGFRDITNATNERTSIFSIEPLNAIGHTNPLIIYDGNALNAILLQGCASSIIFDYPTRFKIAGTHMTYFYLNQLPFFSPQIYNKCDISKPVSKLLELVYTSWDIKSFIDKIWFDINNETRKSIQNQWEENKSDTGGNEWKLPEWKEAYPEIEWERDKGCPLSPFKWDENRRARLKAELDAWYALLYGLERDELRYILDPQDVYGEKFPGETFRVLKEKEIRLFGEYRTRRLVLEAYDRLRPTFDMEAHLKRLEEVMEEYRRMPEISVKPNKETKYAKTKKAYTKDPNQKDIFSK